MIDFELLDEFIISEEDTPPDADIDAVVDTADNDTDATVVDAAVPAPEEDAFDTATAFDDVDTTVEVVSVEDTDAAVAVVKAGLDFVVVHDTAVVNIAVAVVEAAEVKMLSENVLLDFVPFIFCFSWNLLRLIDNADRNIFLKLKKKRIKIIHGSISYHYLIWKC